MRKELKIFANNMESVLKENDYKGGWDKERCDIDYLNDKLLEEVAEYISTIDEESLHYLRNFINHLIIAKGNIDEPKKELVDIANISMMLWHRTKENSD